MTSTFDKTPWAELFPIDAATPLTAVHQGIEYLGEVVRAKRWAPEFGLAPGDGFHFRIVVLQDRPRSGLPDKVDRKTAVCIPASGSSRKAHRIISEITAVKQATYLTRRDPDAAAINSALRERQQGLESQVISEELVRFSRGTIFVEGTPKPNPSEIYVGADPVRWMESLARWLLAHSYPNPPLNAGAIPQPIGQDDAGRLFASLFNQAGADPELSDLLIPALGLTSKEPGGSGDPFYSPVFPQIREFIGDGPAAFAEVHRFLAYDVGLTDQLASLFLLLFIRHQRPEYQIQLNDDSVMYLADGGKLLGARITPDLVPSLAWESRLASMGRSIGPATAPRFIDAGHHLSALCPELAFCNSDVVDETLGRFLTSFASHIKTASRVVDSLATRGESGADASEETARLRAALERLSRISGDGYALVYHSIRAGYPALLELERDLETLRQLASLDNYSEEISEAQRYMANAHVPPVRFPNLAVDRETLLTGLLPSRLARSRGRGWSAVARDAEGFKIRYTQAYREHHRKFHDALPGFQSALLAAKKKLAALQLLSTIDELGPPAGAGLEDELAALAPGPHPCSLQETELDLSKEPYCPNCQLSLEQTVPSAELARLAPQVDMALGGKTQELSRILVKKAIDGRADDRWREFMQMVQASELSSLANTLDSNLVSFIKQVLD